MRSTVGASNRAAAYSKLPRSAPAVSVSVSDRSNFAPTLPKASSTDATAMPGRSNAGGSAPWNANDTPNKGWRVVSRTGDNTVTIVSNGNAWCS